MSAPRTEAGKRLLLNLRMEGWVGPIDPAMSTEQLVAAIEAEAIEQERAARDALSDDYETLVVEHDECPAILTRAIEQERARLREGVERLPESEWHWNEDVDGRGWRSSNRGINRAAVLSLIGEEEARP